MALNDEEFNRFTHLQGMFPEKSFEELLDVAGPYLKSQNSFHSLIERMMSQQENRTRTDSDSEEEKLMENLKKSFMPAMDYNPPREKTLKSKGKIGEKNSFPSDKVNSNVGLIDKYIEEKSEELSQLIYGSSPQKKPESETDTDSEAFLSCGEESHDANPDEEDKVTFNVEANNNLLDSEKWVEETSPLLVSTGQQIQENGIRIEDEPKKKEEDLKNEVIESGNDFSYFNNLINCLKKEESEPEKKQEPEKEDERRKIKQPAEDSKETEADVGQMIDYFFKQETYSKKQSSENSLKNFEEKGAIPKRLGKEKESQRSNNESRFACPPENKDKKNSISAPCRSNVPFGEEEVLRSIGFVNGDLEVKKTEISSPVREKLQLAQFPFAYVVPENPCPNYCLPKGVYYVLNKMDLDVAVNQKVSIVHHPNAKIEIEAAPSSKGFEKSNWNFPSKTSKEPAPETKKVFGLPSLPPPPFSNFRENDTIKINRSEVKAKIFCNTPLQSLKKDGEDMNDSTDAYGAILQSVANDFGSADKFNRRKKNVESSGFEFSSKSDPIPVKEKPSAFSLKDNCNDLSGGFSKIKNSETMISKTDDDLEPKPKSVDSPIILELMKMLKNMKPELLVQQLEECNGTGQPQKNGAEKESLQSSQSLADQALLEEAYSKALKELPELDPEYLYAMINELKDDERAIDSFIQEEKVKVQLEEMKKKLSANFPFFEVEFLDKKAKDFLYDPEGLATFISEEKRKLKIDEQYELMVDSLPNIDPLVLRQKSEEAEGDAEVIRIFIEEKKLEQRKEEEKNNQIINLHLILPDADPEFLQMKLEELSDDPEAFNTFCLELLDSKDYPKIKKDDPAVRERNELWRRFVENFEVKDFLAKVPNPEETYSGNKNDNNRTEIGLILKFLQSRYPDLAVTDLEKIFRDRRCNLANTCVQLDFTHRPIEIMDISFRSENISESFLLELVFILRRREIRDYLREEKALRELKLKKARNEKALLECACCFEEELLDTDVATCPEGHIFCIDCITRSVETKLSDGNTKFECLAGNCGTEFSLVMLENVLQPGLYGKVLRKRQSAEVNEAKVPGLESCPSCDFAYIPNQYDKIFKCQNQECLRETCRTCKEESHVPLRCEEVERPKDTKIRTEIEEKMTEALVRTCPKCGKKFVKTDGCNKMTCTCGTMMCYLCRKVVADYTHFNGQGGDQFHKCQLWSTNEDLHTRRVKEVGVAARDEALRQNPDLHLVHDPTETI